MNSSNFMRDARVYNKCGDTNISIITCGKTLEITITKSRNVFANRAFDMQKGL